MDKNKEINSMFLLGKQGSTHSSLFQEANKMNEEVLGQNWFKEDKYSMLTGILSAGRIWTDKKIIVMRDNRPSPDIVQSAISQLKQQISDIESFNMLYEDNLGYIHECQIQDYI